MSSTERDTLLLTGLLECVIVELQKALVEQEETEYITMLFATGNNKQEVVAAAVRELTFKFDSLSKRRTTVSVYNRFIHGTADKFMEVFIVTHKRGNWLPERVGDILRALVPKLSTPQGT